MEAFAIYLLKSASWLTGFALVYLLFLRNERFFMLKRVYLIAGMVFSIIFPFISVHYQVELPAPELNGAGLFLPAVPVNAPVQQFMTESFDYRAILLFLYLSGAVFLIYKMVRHIIVLYKTINKASVNYNGPAKLVRVSEFPTSFTFFNYVFINPSLGEAEVEEIMNHELVHVKQKHWFDLMMVEILRMVQWVNPFAWIYTGFIRQNHEYLADEAALRNTSNPAIYRAALVNQLFNSPVISLSNSLNYSLNKKRFDMMKKIITSPYRKLKVLLIIPVFAIVFYAFATPEYKYLTTVLNTQSEDVASITTAGEVRGIVLKEDNTPFEGVFVVVTGTNAKATTDASGNFTISNVPKEASLVISQAGYKTQFIKAKFTSKMTINLMKDPDYIKSMQIRSTSPGGTGSNPLVVIDGVISDKGMKDISSADVAQVTVLKDKNATDKYGEKGKDGVIEIISTKKAAELGIKVPFRRKNPEDFPTFQGEKFSTFRNWVHERVKYPEEAQTKKLEGYIQVNFTVEADGTVSNVKSIGSIDPILGEAVAQVVKSSPKWEPAKNPEAQIPYQFSVGLRFRLPDQILIIEEEPFVVVEEMPMYPGGDAELLNFIKANTKYPDAAKTEKIEGRVITRFFVNTEGNVEGVSILKGVHPSLDAEATRVVGLLSGFRPGMQGGKAVNVWYMVPVTFSLGSSSTNSSNQESQFSKSSLTEILKYVVEHTVYPQEARNSSDTGRVFVAVRMNKGGTLNGTVTFSEKNEVNVPVLPQIVIIGYKVTSGPGGISNKPGHPALRAECVRVANQLGDLDIPEWKDKNMEFALAFKFVLE